MLWWQGGVDNKVNDYNVIAPIFTIRLFNFYNLFNVLWRRLLYYYLWFYIKKNNVINLKITKNITTVHIRHLPTKLPIFPSGVGDGVGGEYPPSVRHSKYVRSNLSIENGLRGRRRADERISSYDAI